MWLSEETQLMQTSAGNLLKEISVFTCKRECLFWRRKTNKQRKTKRELQRYERIKSVHFWVLLLSSLSKLKTLYLQSNVSAKPWASAQFLSLTPAWEVAVEDMELWTSTLFIWKQRFSYGNCGISPPGPQLVPSYELWQFKSKETIAQTSIVLSPCSSISSGWWQRARPARQFLLKQEQQLSTKYNSTSVFPGAPALL